eukprot:sb/3472549/
MSKHYVNVEIDRGKLDEANKITDDGPVNSPEHSKAPAMAWRPDDPDKKFKDILGNIAETEEVGKQEEEGGKQVNEEREGRRRQERRGNNDGVRAEGKRVIDEEKRKVELEKMIEQYKKTVDARGRTKFGLRDIRNKRRGISYTPRFSPIHYPEYFQPYDPDEGL